MIDLGVMPKKENEGKDCCASPCSIAGNSDQKDKPSYPQMSIDGAENVDKVLNEIDAKIGTEVEVTVKLRVSGFQDTKWNKSISFDVKSISQISSAKPDDTEDGAPKKSKGMKKILGN